MINLLAPFVTTLTNDSFETLGTPSEVQNISLITGSVVSIMKIIGYVASIFLLAIGIALLIKSIVDIKRLGKEISEENIKKVRTTSIILLVIGILTMCSNFIAVIIAIISLVFANKAMKIFANDFELAKSKIKTAGVLNIINAALMLAAPIITVIFTTILEVVWNSTTLM